jgi:hypothetical protein
VAHIQKAALARANSIYRRPFYFYLDEFQNYTTDNIRDVLSESRKYALSMTLVHQYLEQLAPEIAGALLNTAGAIACFRVGYQDGYQLAKEIFPNSDFFHSSHREEMLLSGKAFPGGSMGKRRDSTWEGLAESLSGLAFREFWHKQRGVRRPTKQRTFDMPLPIITNDTRINIGSLVAASARLYSRSKSVVQAEDAGYNLGALRQNVATGTDQQSNFDQEIPFWGV